MLSALPHDYRAWTPYQVAHWLNSIGLTRWADAFQRHHISGNVLGLLDEEDLDELQLSGGNRTKLLKSIGMLSAQAARQLELQLEVTGAAATLASTLPDPMSPPIASYQPPSDFLHAPPQLPAVPAPAPAPVAPPQARQVLMLACHLNGEFVQQNVARAQRSLADAFATRAEEPSQLYLPLVRLHLQGDEAAQRDELVQRACNVLEANTGPIHSLLHTGAGGRPMSAVVRGLRALPPARDAPAAVPIAAALPDVGQCRELKGVSAALAEMFLAHGVPSTVCFEPLIVISTAHCRDGQQARALVDSQALPLREFEFGTQLTDAVHLLFLPERSPTSSMPAGPPSPHRPAAAPPADGGWEGAPTRVRLQFVPSSDSTIALNAVRVA